MRSLYSHTIKTRNRASQSFNLRAFSVTITCIFSLALVSVFAKKIVSLTHGNHYEASQSTELKQLDIISLIKSNEECRLIHNAEDKCAFVKVNCLDEEAGLFSYLTFYYCNFSSVPMLAFLILTLWLALLFTTIGIAASDFFCINLSTISSIFGMSEGLAGTTLLAFGNGSPDVFSTFAAMNSNSGSLAVGELIGAASFITAIVAGSMALVREFKVGKKTFVRDVGFFIVAASFTMIFLADGALHLWECCVMVGLYLLYVIIVVSWDWYLGILRRRFERETAARGQYPASPNEEVLIIGIDAYDEDAQARERFQTDSEEIDPLEQRSHSAYNPYGDESDEEIQNGIRIAAEMANSMRVTRPLGSRRNTITPIRPSLIGALEFRSALSSLEQKSRQNHGRPIHLHRYSEDLLGAVRFTDEDLEFLTTTGGVANEATSMNKAASFSNDTNVPIIKTPVYPTGTNKLDTGIATATPNPPKKFGLSVDTRVGRSATLSLPSSSTRGPCEASSAHSCDRRLLGTSRKHAYSSDLISRAIALRSQHLHVQIPSATDDSQPCHTPVSQIPIYVDSPDGISSRDIKASSPILPHISRASETNFAEHGLAYSQSPADWWPYQYFPNPHNFCHTLFPTLCTWREKSIWDKFIAIVSAPSIFLLAITLPVVELESPEEDDFATGLDSFLESHSHLGGTSRRGLGSILASECHSHEAEPQWHEHRQGMDSQSCSPSLLHSQNVAFNEGLFHQPNPPPSNPNQNSVSRDQDTKTTFPSEDWNRWLVSVQIFASPLFIVTIVWANSDGENTHLLAEMILYSLLSSFVTYIVLVMTTSSTEIPKYRFLLCFMGFIVSIAWISTIANEVVGILQTFGVVLGISDAILGLTIFAMGNSLGDLVANISVARLGYPVMALSACFGGPILNILLGIGLSGIYITVSDANKRYTKHPASAKTYLPYHINVSDTLIISAATLIITLVGLLIAVPLNRWIMNRRIGWGMIVIWSISTVVNLGVEFIGVWGATDTDL